MKKFFVGARHALPVLLALFAGGPVWAEQAGEWSFRVEFVMWRPCAVITAYTGSDTSLNIPAEIWGLPVIGIGRHAFADWPELVSVIIPVGVTEIGMQAFLGCTGLTSVTIPSSVTKIEGDAFLGCTGLTSVTIPVGVTEMRGDPFSGCTGLTSINVATRNPAYSSRDGTLFDKSGTVLIRYPKGRNGAYSIPAGVTKIERDAFHGCKGLTSITIPSSVTTIGWGRGAFSLCTGLTSINVAAGNAQYSSRDGALFDKSGAVLIEYPPGRNGAYAIPAGVTTIGEVAFFDCTGLTSVSIPASVTTIGRDAFSDCTGLTSVSIPAGVTKIESWAFSGCTGLASVTIPSSVTKIGEGAFFDCTGLSKQTKAEIRRRFGDDVF